MSTVIKIIQMYLPSIICTKCNYLIYFVGYLKYFYHDTVFNIIKNILTSICIIKKNDLFIAFIQYELNSICINNS
jgi:hypothetical protein